MVRHQHILARYDVNRVIYYVPLMMLDLHWDLNVELTYRALYTGNHLDLAFSLINLIANNVDNLIGNVPIDWQYDSAAAPTGASALDCIETCYWSYAIDPVTGVRLACRMLI